MFQSLIGELKTQQTYFYFFNKKSVSIPHRRAKNEKQKETIDETQD